MKQFYRLTTVVALLLFFVGSSWGQTTLKYQSFESGSDNWTYTPDPATYSVGSDVWAVVTNSFHTFSTIPTEGTHFWGMEDLTNSNGGTAAGVWSKLTFESVDVSSYNDVTISFDYEVDGYDNADDIKYQAFFDGTGQSEVLLVDGNSNLNQDGTVTINVTDGIGAVYLIVSIKQNGGDYGGLDNFIVKGTSSTPSAVTLSDNGTQIAAANVNQGTTDVILHQSELAVTLANATLTGMTCTTAGTYVSDDITNLKVRYSTDATLDGSDATLSTLATPGAAGQKTFPSFTSQTIDEDATGYLFITADIADDATHNNTISLNAITTTDLTIANTTLSGSTTAGGVQTFKDVTGPSVSTYNPLDDAEEVAVNTDLVLTFDENIQKGTGNITIKKISDNSIVQTIDVTSDDVSIAGATLTIDPSDLAIGTRYYVNIAAEAIEDISGNTYAGISDNTTWTFTTVAPSVTNVTSTNDNGTYSIGDEITVTVTFTDNVTVTNSPYILLNMGESNRQASYSSGSGTATLSFTYTIQSTDESADLDYVATNSLYENGGSIKSSNEVDVDRTLPTPGEANSLGNNKNIVVDGVRPTVDTYSPADGSSNAAIDQNLVITFSETVQQGTGGNVVIYIGGGVVEFESIPFEDDRITISTNTVTINPTGAFSYASEYYVKISNNVFTDLNGNSYTGIDDVTTWNFTTAVAPETLPFSESFDNSSFPSNWTHTDFTIENSSNAGGSPYEAELNYSNDDPGTSNITTPAINTSSETSLSLSWNQDVDFYEGGTGDNFVIRVLTSTDGSTFGNVAWEQTVTADETTQKTVILDASNGVGSSTLYIKWLYYENNTNRFTAWYIDDVELANNTIYPEPSNHPTGFSASANSSSQITVSWTDASTGAQLPENYLIKAAIATATPSAPSDGTAEADGSLVKNIAQGVGSAVFTELDASTTYNFSIWPYTNSGDDIDYKTDGIVPTTSAETDAAPALPNAWINEIHYDNDGGDVNEMIEIVIENPGNYTLSDFTVNLYNGNGGGSYDSETLDNLTVGNTEGDFTFYTWTSFSSGIQNGAPDGLALSFDGSLIQFLSYEGTFEATDGVAVGVVSTDIGVSETGTTPVGYSLQLSGLGTQYSDFTWQEPALATAGTLNNNQAFVSSTWTGGASTIDWVTAGNWSNGVPTATVDVIINNTDYDPAISSAASCNSITINSGAILTINAGKSLTVNGTLTNSAGNTGLVLESDAANGNAYLIHSTADVAATVKNYFTGVAESWHLLSSPVASQVITGDFIPAGSYDDGTGYDIYTWYEVQELWVNFKNGTTAPTWTTVNGSNNFLVGNGYMVAYEAANPTKSFAGNLNQGEVTYALTNSGSGTYESMNLVGNPYPSAIDWKASSGWDRSHLGSSAASKGNGHNMYIYNQAEGNYGAYNSGSSGNAGTNGNSRYITSCQGFLVYASSAGDLVMNNDIRVTDHQAFLKSDEEISDYLKLRVTGSSISYSDEAIIEFNHGSDEGGAPKLFSSISEAPSLYTLKNTEEYSINFLRELNEDIIVPLGFSAGVDGSYTINATQLESFKNGTLIYLEDKNLNTTIELSKTSTYTFTASTTDASDRFLLHFKSTTAVEDMEALEANIYAYDGKIYISGINQMNNVRAEVLSVDGRTLYTESYHGEAVVNVPGHFVPGCYLVRLSSEKAVLTKKLIIR